MSVIVPVYNGADHVLHTLRCVANQTYQNIEIIVVDDSSTDNSVELIRSSGIALRLIAQPNARVSAARNRGLAESKGQFVCFLDQDDEWSKNHIERQVHCFEMHPEIGVVFSPLQRWYPEGDEDHRQKNPINALPAVQLDPRFSGWIYHQFLLDCWALTSATMIRRDAIVAVGGFNEQLPFSEDWDLWLRLSRHVQFAHLIGLPVLYRQHPVQGSRMPRPIDHRSELLLANASRYGLASQDGRSIDPKVFTRTIARYQASFGYHHLQYGDAGLGVQALWKAWRRRPSELRTFLLAIAGSLGWRPARDDFPITVAKS